MMTRRRFRLLTLLALLFTLLFAGSCDATQLLVEVHADQNVASKLVYVRAFLYSADATDESKWKEDLQFAVTANPPSAGELSFPFSFGIAKGHADRFKLVVKGYESSDPTADAVIEQKAITSFRDGLKLTIRLSLLEPCYQHVQQCAGLDRTCWPEPRGAVRAGECGPVPDLQSLANPDSTAPTDPTASTPKETDDCPASACLNGSCVDGAGDYYCACNPGYAYDQINKRCNDIVDCTAELCAHGRCVDGVNSYMCMCDPGYAGTGTRSCGGQDDCPPSACANGTCVDGESAYSCRCNPGFMLDPSQHSCLAVNDCPANACVHGRCRDGVNTWDCACDPGYSGTGTQGCMAMAGSSSPPVTMPVPPTTPTPPMPGPTTTGITMPVTVSVSVAGVGGTVSVTSPSSRANCVGTSCTFEAGGSAVLTAIPQSGYTVNGWSCSLSRERSITLSNVRSNTTCTLSFVSSHRVVVSFDDILLAERGASDVWSRSRLSVDGTPCAAVFQQDGRTIGACDVPHGRQLTMYIDSRADQYSEFVRCTAGRASITERLPQGGRRGWDVITPPINEDGICQVLFLHVYLIPVAIRTSGGCTARPSHDRMYGTACTAAGEACWVFPGGEVRIATEASCRGRYRCSGATPGAWGAWVSNVSAVRVPSDTMASTTPSCEFEVYPAGS